MTFIGKLLLAVNFVLSICFMVFAGAVFSAQTNWKSDAEKAKAEISKVRGELNAALQQAQEAQAAADDARETADGQIRDLDGRLKAAEDEKAALAGQLEQERANLQRQIGLAEQKAREAQFRRDEAVASRSVNKELHARLDAVSSDAAALEDEVFGKDVALEQTRRQYLTAAEELAGLKKILALSNLSTDPSEYTAREEPPPPVDGIVRETRSDRSGRIDLVEISLGSDDGLKRRQKLDVYRPAEQNNGRALYLGEIQLVEVYNDTAVARVVQRAKNGIIQESDHVTSRL